MCGIAGCFNRQGEFSLENMKAMTDALERRGPDAKGYYHDADEKVFLGHRRLSIIDLSSAANQPMKSACGRYVIVFNGEIYNYKELALKYNLKLKTTGDTEVIVELFALMGKACVSEFNGMFAFAIYDLTQGVIFVCRDRLGVKPLYIYSDDSIVAFASELKSFLKVEAILKKTTINKRAIGLFLHLGYIPQPYSIYNEITKFPAGACAVITDSGITTEIYWSPEAQVTPTKNKDQAEVKKTLKDLLVSSVQYRMISDVPFGTFLSGGTDSSLVTAIAQEQSKGSVKTFSIGFKEAKYNESEHARKIARFLNTDHEEFILSEKIAIESIEDIMEYFDEPFSDSSALPTSLVSKMSAQKVKMVLTGDGGDELFMGYGAYRWADRLRRKEVLWARKSLIHLMKLTRKSKYNRIAELLNFDSNLDIKSHIFSQEQYCFSLTELDRVLTNSGNYIQNDWIDIKEVSRTLSKKEEQALFDLKYYLKDDLLVKVDRSSMYSSIEAREPLLDYRIVEYALNIDESLKSQKGVDKFILKEILYDYIPKQYLNRPKWGFGIPLSKWLKGDLRYMIEKYLSPKEIVRYGILNSDEVELILKRFFSGQDYLYNRIWLMIILQKWLQKYYIK